MKIQKGREFHHNSAKFDYKQYSHIHPLDKKRNPLYFQSRLCKSEYPLSIQILDFWSGRNGQRNREIRVVWQDHKFNPNVETNEPSYKKVDKSKISYKEAMTLNRRLRFYKNVLARSEEATKDSANRPFNIEDMMSLANVFGLDENERGSILAGLVLRGQIDYDVMGNLVIPKN